MPNASFIDFTGTLIGKTDANIRTARVHTDEIGCVLETVIYWSDFDFTGVEWLNHCPEKLLPQALVQAFMTIRFASPKTRCADGLRSSARNTTGRRTS